MTASTNAAPAMAAMQFSDLDLPETLMKAIAKMGFSEPTPIQAQSIPHALAGKDVLGSASTGTGKTAAFAIPMIAHLIASPRSHALVMTPTRELAIQVLATIQPLLLMHREIRTACLIGGEPMGKQFAQLNQKPRIIVGTPGRINDHLNRESLKLDHADFLVLDETDRMLDMGFDVQIETIIPLMREKRQTLMFSATIAPQIARLSSRYLVEPVRVSVGSTNKPAAKIKQEQIHLKDSEKYDVLLEQLEQRTGSVIIFVKTKHGADKLATRLCRDEHRADAIHGDLQQRRRERVIQNFRDQKYRILVATDVAARGLDIPHIEHVVNYDLPQSPEDYVHRIGRTARAGAEGEAVNFIGSADGAKWKAIQRLINPEEVEKDRKPRKGGQRSGGAKGDGFKKPSRFERSQRVKGGWKKDRDDSGRSQEGDDFKPARKRFERSESDRSERFERSERPARSERAERSGERSNRKPSEGRGFERRSFEGRSFEGRASEGRASEGRAARGRSEDKRENRFEKRVKDRDDSRQEYNSENRSKGRFSERSDRNKSGGRSFGKSSEGRTPSAPKKEWRKSDDSRSFRRDDDARGGERSFKKRDDRSEGKSFSKSFDKKPSDRKSFDKKPTGDKKPFGDKKRSGKPDAAKKKPFKFKQHARNKA